MFAGDSVADLIVDALALGGLRLHDGDILVVKHKIVSKAEGSDGRTRFGEAVGSGRRFGGQQWRRCAGD